MGKNWTPAQKEAIDAKGSTLVSASAGTGKTAVLTEKVVNTIMNNGVDISNILVMTFSNAAATEMADRIRGKLVEIMLDKENTTAAQRQRAHNQVQKFNMAHIKTIHAFCNDIVKKFTYKIGIDAGIETANAFDIRLLKTEAINEILDEEYFLQTPDFVALEESIDGSDSLENVIIACYNKLMSFVNPMEWLDEAVEKYNISDDEMPEFVKDMIVNDLKYAVTKLHLAITELQALNDEKAKKNLTSMKADEVAILEVLENVKTGAVDAITTTSFNDTFPTIRFTSKECNFDHIKELRSEAKDIIDKYRNFDMKEQLNRIKFMYDVVAKFAEIIKKFDTVYTQKKKDSKCIDFNDMEKYAYEILSNNPEIAKTVANSFAMVFVDEYQDTNPVQEAIINKISTADNLFCVGDIKQSIYRFRASDPLLFLKRSADYKSGAKKGNIISLNSNFRSTQNVLECANDVFNHITKISNEITYSEDDALIHGRVDDGACNPVIVNIIGEDVKNKFKNLTTDEIEAYQLISTIKKVVGSEIYDQDKDTHRPATYGDIAILCRKLTGLSDTIAQLFNANDIPFIIDKAGELLKCTEVQILLNILDLAVNAQNDIKLISLVHEGLFDFTDDDLIAIRSKNLKDTFYNNMQECMKNNDELAAKCQRLFMFLATCKEMESYSSVIDIIDFILTETNFYDYFAVMSNGEKRVANINLLCQHATDYCKNHDGKILGFTQYIKKIDESGETVSEADNGYAENKVRITTIHKSKGLEYPVVILAFMGKAFSSIDKRTNILLDKDSGIGVRYFDSFDRIKGKNLMRTYIENMISAKNIEEEMRLLYVAMTRAKEQLYIQGAIDTAKTNLNNSRSMLDWIISTIMTGTDVEDVCVVKGMWKVEPIDTNAIEEIVSNEHENVDNETLKSMFSIVDLNAEAYVEEKNEPVPMSIASSEISSDVKSAAFEMPEFNKKEFSATDIGTLTHIFMKHLDFKGDLTIDGLKAQADEMIAKNYIAPIEKDRIFYANIAKFFETEYGKLMANADEYMRELPVSIIKKASDIEVADSDEDVLVRCIIDIVFVKDGKYYIADYKTDRISSSEEKIAQAVNNHRTQLELYTEAFSTIYKVPVESTNVIFISIAQAKEI